MPGYHFIIKPDGEVVQLLEIEKVSNGVKGFNSVSINISYIGGVDAQNKPIDNRTEAQKKALLDLLKKLKKQFPKAIIQGHRDFPDVKKACPSFDAKEEYKNL
nr:MAG TPA: endodeoxyribonuclease I [Caudoviricetes sp.]